MVRPVRKKQTPKKYSTESFILGIKLNVTQEKTSPVVEHVRRSLRKQETKRQASNPKKNAVSRHKTNNSNDFSNSTGAEEKKTVKDSVTKKRSPRLRKGKTSTSPLKNDSILGKDERKNVKSLLISNKPKLKMSNRSKQNNSEDEKLNNSDRRNISNDNSKTKTVTIEKKFFKSKIVASSYKANIFTEKKVTRKKNMAKNSDEEIKIKGKPAMRQTTLSESFRRSSVRNRLRPRKISVKRNDSSDANLLLSNSISPAQRKSIVLLNRIDEVKANKAPIYKTVKKLTNEKEQDKDNIYDFQIDPGEKRTKIKRKRAPRKTRVKEKHETVPMAIVIPKIDNMILQKAEQSDEMVSNTLKAKNIVPSDQEPENMVPNTPKIARILEEIKNFELPEPEIQTEAIIQPENLTELKRSQGVRISRVELLTGNKKVSFKSNLSSTGQNVTKLNPFRSTQSIFKARPTLTGKDMLDHSLFNKSLSPIKGEIGSFDSASPWRPYSPSTFPNVKKVVQSTPQIKRNLSRVKVGLRIDEKKDAEDENAEAKITIRSVNPLGTRSSNAENIENGKKLLGLSLNYGDNKKNQVFGDRLYKSPKKIDKSTSSTTSFSFPGLKKRTNQITSKGEPINESENSPPLAEETKLFKQSNLNMFLNIEEMPERVQINTSHGIFGDDVSSTMLVKTPLPKSQLQTNIENCFGFDDNDSGVEETTLTLDKQLATNSVKKIFNRLKGRVLPAENRPTSRISLGEIKNTLYPRQEKKVENLERKEDRNEKKEIDLGLKSTEVLNPAQFSDTFDLMTESKLGNSKDTEIALFTDLEPVHFTKPPRWSYAKKRERINYDSSDEEDDNETDYQAAPVIKKRKVGKVKKLDEKKINDWVNSVNETFQEIDNFDLVIEKLT